KTRCRRIMSPPGADRRLFSGETHPGFSGSAELSRSNPSKRVFIWIVACWGGMTLGGCGPAAVDDLPRQPVSGKVALDGQPLDQGTITFSPATELPTPGMVSVTGGSYSLPRTQGLVAGR